MDSLIKGMEILAARQKCIILADSSELGWKAVEEYGGHILAEDSIFLINMRDIFKLKIQYFLST